MGAVPVFELAVAGIGFYQLGALVDGIGGALNFFN